MLVARVEIEAVFQQMVDALEAATHADGPGDRRATDIEDALDLVEQFQRRTAFAVQLVDEGDDGRGAQARHFHQLDGTRLDALGGVDDHQRAVYRGERAVGVFREVFMARRIEQVDDLAVVGELHHRGGDGDTALLFQRHPVGRRMARGLAALDRTGELDRSSEQQEFFRQRGLARVRMGNDGESAPQRRLSCSFGHDEMSPEGARF